MNSYRAWLIMERRIIQDYIREVLGVDYISMFKYKTIYRKFTEYVPTELLNMVSELDEDYIANKQTISYNRQVEIFQTLNDFKDSWDYKVFKY